MCLWLLLALITQSYCFPQNSDATILQQQFLQVEEVENGSRNYYFRFKTSNKIQREERGIIHESEGLEINGHYSYLNSNNETETVNYIADKDGFRITSKDLFDAKEVPLIDLRISSAALASLAG